MTKFYFQTWLSWVLRVFLCTLSITLFLSTLISSVIYFKQDMPPLSSEIYSALYEIGKFWFMVVWNLSFLLALFRSIKYIFNKPRYGYQFILSDCKFQHYIDPIGYGDLVKVWRKWFMLLIWLVVVMMIFATLFLYLFSSRDDLFAWFNVWWLFGFVIISGYFSFVLLPNRCKEVKVKRC